MVIFDIPEAELFALIEPITVTDAMYVAASEPNTTEGDPANAWNAATAYVLEDRVYKDHRVYERIVAGTTATDPADDDVNWVLVGATNGWKMFDLENSSRTVGPVGNLVFTVTLSASHNIDRITFDNLDATSIQVEVWNAALTVKSYDVTVSLLSADPDRTWAVKRAVVFDGLPDMVSKKVIVTATPLSSTKAEIGSMVLGHLRVLGVPQSGFSVGITDFSRMQLDDFGGYSRVVRGYSKRMSGTLLIESDTVDAVIGVLAYNRANVVVWLGIGAEYSSMIMCGFLKNFNITVSGPVHSYCSIDIQGVA